MLELASSKLNLTVHTHILTTISIGVNMNKPRWTEEEVKFLIENYDNKSVDELSTILKKSVRALSVKATKLKLRRSRKQQSNFDLVYIKNMIKSGCTIGDVARKMGTHPDTLKSFCIRNNYNHLVDYGEQQDKTGWRVYKKGHSGLLRLYRTYETNAKKRNYEFSLSLVEFEELTKGLCHYCNIEPNQEFYSGGHKSPHSKYIYNGIDRLDNTKGYSIDNCKSCCGTCNKMKMDLNREDFIKKILQIANQLNKD